VGFSLVALVTVPARAQEGTDPTTGADPTVAEHRGLRDMIELVFDVTLMVKDRYLDEVDLIPLVRGMLRGMTESLGDPYSVYYEPQQFGQFFESVQGAFSGVGIVITQRDGKITVISAIPGTPAERAGLQPNDVLLKVDDRDTAGLDTDAVAGLIRGDTGTTVRLTVQRGNAPPFEVSLQRELINVPSVEWRMLDGNIAYLRVVRFVDKTGEDCGRAIDAIKAAGVTGIVLDLRGNPGGLLDEAVTVAGYFQPEESPVVYVVERGGQRDIRYSHTPQQPYPLVVLVNGGTASAAEIVAGAIQDWQTGTLVGTKTFGKGTVQSVYNLGAYGGMRLTTAEYRTPINRSVRDKGLTPDVVVEAPAQPQDAARKLVQGFTRDMRAGMVGLDVLALQDALREAGHDPGGADGVFGARTAAALRAAQAAHGLAATGVADRATADALAASETSTADVQLERGLDILKEKIRAAAPAA